MKETVRKYQDLLKSKGAEIVHEEHWGMRKLAYPIQKKSTGFYHLIEYKAEGEKQQGNEHLGIRSDSNKMAKVENKK
jgi:ribosomal protein S6